MTPDATTKSRPLTAVHQAPKDEQGPAAGRQAVVCARRRPARGGRRRAPGEGVRVEAEEVAEEAAGVVAASESAEQGAAPDPAWTGEEGGVIAMKTAGEAGTAGERGGRRQQGRPGSGRGGLEPGACQEGLALSGARREASGSAPPRDSFLSRSAEAA